MTDIPSDPHPALIAKWEAEAAFAEAQAHRTRLEADLAQMSNEIAVIETERELWKRKVELAQNDHYYTYPFTSDVSANTSAALMRALQTWARIDEREGVAPRPMEIIFNSPGGSVVDGLALFDHIQTIRRRGHHVTTVAQGIAASMAGVLLQAGDTRVLTKESWLMIHEASFGIQGKTGEVEDRVEWVKGVQKRLLNIFAARSNLTVRQLDQRWKRKDWWINSDEALRLGLADEVR